jgi:hypothetical protein
LLKAVATMTLFLRSPGASNLINPSPQKVSADCTLCSTVACKADTGLGMNALVTQATTRWESSTTSSCCTLKRSPQQ